MKTVAWILGVILLYQVVIHQVNNNNSFTADLDVTVDSSRTYTLPPGDTVVFMMPVTNNSWHHVEFLAASSTCNVISVDAPVRFNKKRVYNIPVSVQVPDAVGNYADAVVLRTTATETFYGTDIIFNVDDSAERVDTLWMGSISEYL